MLVVTISPHLYKYYCQGPVYSINLILEIQSIFQHTRVQEYNEVARIILRGFNKQARPPT